jgi:hypothetical protein
MAPVISGVGGTMLQGKCTKCGAMFYGWALNSPRNQMCGYCGAALEISDESGKKTIGYSPFEAEEYKIKGAQKSTAPETSKKE